MRKYHCDHLYALVPLNQSKDKQNVMSFILLTFTKSTGNFHNPR